MEEYDSDWMAARPRRPKPLTFGQIALPLCFAVIALGFAWVAFSLFFAAAVFSQMAIAADAPKSQLAWWLAAITSGFAIVSGGCAVFAPILKQREKAWVGVVILLIALATLFFASGSLVAGAAFLAIGNA